MDIIAVVIDDYKLDIFKEVFAANKITFELGAGPTSESLTLRVQTDDRHALEKIVREANATAIERSRAAVPVEIPPNMTYELWHTETNRLLGTLELGNPPAEHAHKARVSVKLRKGTIEVKGRVYNAVQVLMCQMDIRDDKKRIKRRYWALETNLPEGAVRNLDGFTPKLERPSLAQMFFLTRNTPK